MKSKIIIPLILLLSFSAVVLAQDDFKAEQKQAWAKFSKNGWDKIDYTKKKLTRIQLAKVSSDGFVDELALLRGVVFGKRGRIFKERSIQDYLEKQAWYKPKANFTNAVLTKIERDNLDAIRLTEAERHSSVKPGDLRYWQAKEIPDDNLYADTPSDWRIMIAEVEAVHGKRFDDEPWLQKYFEERYWYKANANYNQSVLSEIERKNLEKLNAKRNEDRNVAIAVGDMDRFQTVLLTEDLLKNLTMNDLRMLRNEFWARRGRAFTTPGFKQMFEWRDWYKPLKDQSKVKLSATEEQNVKFLEAEEAKLRNKISTEPITNEMVEGLFIEDLRVLRNEIYARHGRVFKDPELQKYFAAQSWYQPNIEFKDDGLTETEVKNLAIIKEVESNAISKFSEAEG
jgi:uncharacterized protein YaiI (UPF0178 family)